MEKYSRPAARTSPAARGWAIAMGRASATQPAGVSARDWEFRYLGAEGMEVGAGRCLLQTQRLQARAPSTLAGLFRAR